MCNKIGYKFYCEELFIVKYKTSYNCESAIYFNLDTSIVREVIILDFTITKQI